MLKNTFSAFSFVVNNLFSLVFLFAMIAFLTSPIGREVGLALKKKGGEAVVTLPKKVRSALHEKTLFEKGGDFLKEQTNSFGHGLRVGATQVAFLAGYAAIFLCLSYAIFNRLS